jgi:glycine cleavage system H protein
MEGDIATVGISDYAQTPSATWSMWTCPTSVLSLRPVAEFGVAESVKASSELYLPAAGEIIAVNGDVSQQTDLVNTDP